MAQLAHKSIESFETDHLDELTSFRTDSFIDKIYPNSNNKSTYKVLLSPYEQNFRGSNFRSKSSPKFAKTTLHFFEGPFEKYQNVIRLIGLFCFILLFDAPYTLIHQIGFKFWSIFPLIINQKTEFDMSEISLDSSCSDFDFEMIKKQLICAKTSKSRRSSLQHEFTEHRRQDSVERFLIENRNNSRLNPIITQ